MEEVSISMFHMNAVWSDYSEVSFDNHCHPFHICRAPCECLNTPPVFSPSLFASCQTSQSQGCSHFRSFWNAHIHISICLKHIYPDVLFVCVSLFFCQTKPSPAGLKMCAVNCFVLAVVFCIACIVLYCIGFKVFVSVLVFCIGFSVLNCLQCFVLVVGFAAKAHGLS